MGAIVVVPIAKYLQHFTFILFLHGQDTQKCLRLSTTTTI